MSKWINVDSIINKFNSHVGFTTCADVKRAIKLIQDEPSIDLADYVPKDFHDKTCEAMAKAHQEEIADIVRVVRCKECKKCYKDTDALTKQTVLICQKHKHEFDWEKVEADDFCSYGEREGE